MLSNGPMGGGTLTRPTVCKNCHSMTGHNRIAAFTFPYPLTLHILDLVQAHRSSAEDWANSERSAPRPVLDLAKSLELDQLPTYLRPFHGLYSIVVLAKSTKNARPAQAFTGFLPPPSRLSKSGTEWELGLLADRIPSDRSPHRRAPAPVELDPAPPIPFADVASTDLSEAQRYLKHFKPKYHILSYRNSNPPPSPYGVVSLPTSPYSNALTYSPHPSTLLWEFRDVAPCSDVGWSAINLSHLDPLLWDDDGESSVWLGHMQIIWDELVLDAKRREVEARAGSSPLKQSTANVSL
mgnify:CR=1 FL=1